MKKIIALLAAIMLLLSACSSATLDGAGKELEDTIANATDADNKYVQMVKGGYRPDDPDRSKYISTVKREKEFGENSLYLGVFL